jgi:flavorubredoxin
MEIPARFLSTETIAPETFLIRQGLGEGMGPVVAPINTMVIRGAEPVVVDTGLAITRDGWLEHLFEIVDPTDVRWIYLSHDDTDHTGAVFEVLDRCPSATVVTNMFSVLRMSADRTLPFERLRFVNPGESLDVGDRSLTAVVPPIFDSPTTRGLFDPTTGVYWAADAFAVESATVVDSIKEIHPGEFREAFLQTQRMISPWHNLLDPVKYARHLDTLRNLQPAIAVGCHGPAFVGDEIDSAFRLYEELPYLPPATLVGQSELEMLLSLLAAPAPAPAPAV